MGGVTVTHEARWPSALRGPLRQEVSPTATFVVFAAVMVMVSRGVFEATIGKTAGYAIQLMATLGLAAFLFLFGKPRKRPSSTVSVVVLYAFICAELLSAVATLWLSHGDYFAPYIAVMTVYTGLLTLYGAAVFDVASRIAFGPVLSAVSAALVAVAMLQQYFGYASLPGSDLASIGGSVRPASLTGSFLHYPIALSILFFMITGLYLRERRRYLFFVAIVDAASIVLSYSRSGMMILALGILLAGMLAPSVGRQLRAAFMIAFAGMAVLFFGSANPYLARSTSAFDPEAGGNAIRLAQWGKAIRMWIDSPMVIGRYTGMVTNVTSNVVDPGSASTVVESGLLQQLVNFGVVGVVSFYAIMILTVRAVPRADVWVRAGLVAAILESFIYQSIEVLPFMCLFAFAAVVFSASDDRAARANDDVGIATPQPADLHFSKARGPVSDGSV